MILSIADIIARGRRHDFTDDELPDLCAVIMTESGGDTEAVQVGGLGRGIVQIDLGEHPDVTEEQAFDPDFALDFARRLSRTPARFGPPNWYGPRDQPEKAAQARSDARVLLGPADDTPPVELDTLAQRLFGIRAPLDPLSGFALTGPTGYGTVEGALDFMERNLDLGEYPAYSNQNWLTQWYGMGPVAWCAITVSRALIEGGFGNPDQIAIAPVETTSPRGWAYCPYVEADFRAAGRWYDIEPQPGDLVLYDWDEDGWADHVGLLREVRDDGALLVYEGNTDEGALRLKVRSRTYVRGFGRPPYGEPPPPPPPPQEEAEMSHVTVRPGERALIPVEKTVVIAAPAPGAIIDLAWAWPSERRLGGVDGSRSFAGLESFDVLPGETAVEVINASPNVIITVATK